MDDTKTERDAAAFEASSPNGNGRAGFCQECGKPLAPDTLRRVAGGVFCEPCAATRQPLGGWQSVHSAASNNGFRKPGSIPPVGRDEPNPAVAGLLGLIPGVGAMFNAQYAKGAMHLIVFVILLALADNVYWGFWWFVWGWIFYQAFDAYHTARARRDHMPLPNPFGWNDIGERMGFGGRSANPQAAPTVPLSEAHGTSGANWAGYVPPRDPRSVAESPFATYPTDNPYVAPYTPPVRPASATMPAATNIPYAPTYTGAAPTGSPAAPPPLSGTRRFPVGALWLIGLGVLFLSGNLLPEWRLSGRWFAPILLGVLAFWTGFRRLEVARTAQVVSGVAIHWAGALVGPVVLLTIAVLLGLQTGDVLPLRRSWPVLLVVWGTMLLLQRSSATPGYAPPPEAANAVPPPPVRSTSGTGSMGL